MATTYTVHWHNAITGDARSNRVALVDGRTTSDDIPRIIAVKEWGIPSMSGVIVVDYTEAVA